MASKTPVKKVTANKVVAEYSVSFETVAEYDYSFEDAVAEV